MSNFNLTIKDNTGDVMKYFEASMKLALEEVGTNAVSHAKEVITDTEVYGGIDLTAKGEKNNSRVDTGRLRNSIAQVVKDNAVYIGSNVEYAPYHELGTGIHASQPGGRKGYWVYIAGEKSSSSRRGKTYNTLEEALKVVAILRSKGLDAHATNGLYPIHFLKKAASEHLDEYKQIMYKWLNR